VVLALAAAGLPAAYAQVERPRPPILQRAGFDTKLGAQVDMGLEFCDEQGKAVKLSELAAGRPVILNLAYYECPMLCTLVINGLVDCLKQLPFVPGKDITVLTVSFDHTETPELAAKKKASYLESYGRPEAAAGWHFLTGGEPAIRSLTDSVGFRFAYDKNSQEFAHASGIVVLTPDGRISHYFYGVQYVPTDVRLGLVDASEGKIGTFADKVLLFCYHYDAMAGAYSMALMRVVQAGCFATIAAVGGFVILSLRRERRQRRAMAAPA
jgi:protein SCO1/2